MGIKENAAVKLSQAYNEALKKTSAPTCTHKAFIDSVIDNTHLTYKYVLFTAILSKATDASINALCLQKKSTLPGAYDARTVCHQVIVPFEMTTLNKVLGGSNEPFLNKPARFTELSKTNAVRRGNDQTILNSLCDNLPKIKSSEEAYSCLVYLLYKLIKLREAQASTLIFTIPESANLPSKLMTFVNRALEQSYEGEVLTLMVAGVYHLLFKQPNTLVDVHPVNQCGASGREISDLDVFINSELVSSNELKDKQYAETDVKHAADKVMQAGGTKMLFIEGPRGEAVSGFKKNLEAEYSRRNFMLQIISYKEFFATTVSLIPTIDCAEFVRYILQTAHDTKFKEEVISYIDNLAQEVLNLTR